jgi:hypothetical protein
VFDCLFGADGLIVRRKGGTSRYGNDHWNAFDCKTARIAGPTLLKAKNTMQDLECHKNPTLFKNMALKLIEQHRLHSDFEPSSLANAFIIDPTGEDETGSRRFNFPDPQRSSQLVKIKPFVRRVVD